MTKKVTYKDWVFEIDFERTTEVYNSMNIGSPELCGCNDCSNFVENREFIYPEEVKLLLIKLGIDYHKESEICHYCKLDNGLHLYGGWFHFKGKIVEGKDCKVSLPNGGSTFNSINVNENFDIAFMKDNSLHAFEASEKNDLIQVEFMVKSKWVIDKSIESE
jgi:hypothetical protein